MKLLAGATGFNPPPGAPADLKTFTAVCCHAARSIDATVTGVMPAGVAPNFHTVAIAHAQHHIAVLRHTTLPFIAFARPHADGDVMVTFVDHPDLAAALTNLTDAEALTAEQLGRTTISCFPRSGGTPMEPTNLSRSFARLRETAGLPGVRLHALRHTVVSLLMELGVPPHVVQAIARHADVKITLKVYTPTSTRCVRLSASSTGSSRECRCCQPVDSWQCPAGNA